MMKGRTSAITSNPFSEYWIWKNILRLDPATSSRYSEPFRQDIEAALGRKGLMNKEVGGRPVHEWGMQPFRNFDLLAVMPIWQTTFEASYSRAKASGMNHAQAERAAATDARAAIRKTQASGTAFERNLAQLGPEWMRGAIMFMSEPLKSWQYWRTHIVGDLFRAYDKGKQTGGREGGFKAMMGVFWSGAPNQTSIKRRIFFQTVVPAVMMGILFRRRLPDWEDFWTDMIAHNVSKLPIIGPAIQSRLLYDWREASIMPSYLDLTSRFANVMGDVVKGEPTVQTAHDLARGLGDATGLPSLLIDDAFKWAKGEREVFKMLGLERREKADSAAGEK